MSDPETEQTEEETNFTIEGETPDFAWFAADADEQRRAFIFKWLANAEIDGDVAVRNMQRQYEWLKNGTMPEQQKPKKANLRPVQT